MGWLGSAMSSLGSAISGALSTVSSAVGSLGGMIGGVAGSLLKVASPYVSAVLNVINVISTILGVIKPEENLDELGDKAINADKQLEDFDTSEEYIEYLRNDVPFDKEKFDKLSDGEKLARSAIGASIALKGVEDKKGFEISTDTLTTLAKMQKNDLIKEGDFDKVLDEFKYDQKELNDFVDGKSDFDTSKIVEDKLSSMYQELEPELSKEEIKEKIFSTEIDDK
jgi:hypothetical protein